MKKSNRKSTQRSRRRNRRAAAGALDTLLCRILGLVWERGRAIDEAGTCATAEVFGEVEIALCLVGGGVIDVSVNAFVDSDWAPVFSAQLAETPAGAEYKWWGGRCALNAWHRGGWELVIAKHATARRSLADLRSFGLTRGAA